MLILRLKVFILANILGELGAYKHFYLRALCDLETLETYSTWDIKN